MKGKDIVAVLLALHISNGYLQLSVLFNLPEILLLLLRERIGSDELH